MSMRCSAHSQRGSSPQFVWHLRKELLIRRIDLLDDTQQTPWR